MTIDEMAKHLEATVQPYGREAWKIATEWAKNGRLKKLSLHDLHELSKMISDALDDAHEPAPKPEETSKDASYMALLFLCDHFADEDNDMTFREWKREFLLIRSEPAPKPEDLVYKLKCPNCGSTWSSGNPIRECPACQPAPKGEGKKIHVKVSNPRPMEMLGDAPKPEVRYEAPGMVNASISEPAPKPEEWKDLDGHQYAIIDDMAQIAPKPEVRSCEIVAADSSENWVRLKVGHEIFTQGLVTTSKIVVVDWTPAAPSAGEDAHG